MAEGGEAPNEVFKPDLPNEDHDVTLLSMMGDDMSQTRPSIGEELRQVTETQKAGKINKFYNYIGRELPDYVSPSDFELDKNNHLFINTIVSGKKVRVQLTMSKNPDKFYAWSTLKTKLPVTVIRSLGLSDNRVLQALHSQAVASLQRIDASLPNSEIELQDLGLTNLTSSALEVNKELTTLKTLQTNEDTNIDQVMETINDPPLLSLRELQGLDKALQSVRGETMMNLAKLGELDKHIEKQKNKLAEADDANLSIEVKQMIQKRLADLYTERAARLEALSINREKLITNFARIKETVHKILHEDTTLAERIQTLFREQGVTIFSILTAVGMTISTLVLALTRTVGIGGGSAGPGEPGGSGGSPVKDWIKKTLQNIANLLKRLGDKLVDALPGILGSVFSWIFNTASKVVVWASEHLWSLFIIILLWLLKIINPN